MAWKPLPTINFRSERSDKSPQKVTDFFIVGIWLDYFNRDKLPPLRGFADTGSWRTTLLSRK
jgi:hypothetical protein